MVHGDLKGVGTPSCTYSTVLTSLSYKANILIDGSGHARLADFGLLTIIADPAKSVPPSSYLKGGTVRYMGPEMIDPQKFGSKENGGRTISSDCYALGMVIYETISGNMPFYEHSDLIVTMKVVKGKHPTRGSGVPRRLWSMLERCWASPPDNRPEVRDVLKCLRRSQNRRTYLFGMVNQMRNRI
jgi:serine/threonine protein kinase